MRLTLFAIVSGLLLLLAARLLRSSRRSGGRPEWWLGLAFGAVGATVWLIPFAAREGMAPEAAKTAALAAQLGISASIAGLARFTWLVFRPTSGAAGLLAGALIAANLAGGAALVATRTAVPVGALGLAVLSCRAAVMFWLFAESAHYARAMQLRLRLGLAEPLVANRFVLWSIWTGALAFVPAFVLALRISGLIDEPVPGQPLPVALRAVFAALGAGLAVALAACWLAFYPTAWYRSWIERRAPA